ncbi:MAG: NCS2 family nucleobase:cation symporter [Lactobacillaceae bacterium]|jgi:uracil permease|nr:NCS2 family nucleobase:cation symporter [Lactobacillaceae bacterium]
MSKQHTDVILDVQDKPALPLLVGLSLQHMVAMFSGTLLVPLLVGLSPAVGLFSSGVGTLLHILITRKKIPMYMGASFAFLVPMAALMHTTGYPSVASGVISVGIIYLIIAALIALVGTKIIAKIFPPIVVGPIVMAVGLSLATSVATNGTLLDGKYDIRVFIVTMLTLGLTIFFNSFFKGPFGMLSILLGIISGYILAIVFGLVDLQPVVHAHWFAVPQFQIPFVSFKPVLNWEAIVAIAPLAMVSMTDHFGYLMTTGELTDRDYLKNPDLKRTIAGNGVATMFSGLVGGPALTSYGENIGVLALTKVHSVYALIGAAIFAIMFSFVGKLAALVATVPAAVTGGVSFLLFGVIAVSGMRIIVENKLDFNDKRNLMIGSSILVIGIGNAYLQIGAGPHLIQFSGLTIATVVGIILNLILPKESASK